MTADVAVPAAPPLDPLRPNQRSPFERPLAGPVDPVRRAALGERLAALGSVIAMTVLLYSTMGFLLMGFISTALPMAGVPVSIWGPLDAIAAAALGVVCIRWGMRCWPLERDLGAATPGSSGSDDDA